MDYRGVLLAGILSGVAVVSATTSCSGPDPGQITFSERPRGSSGETTSGGPGGPAADGGGGGGGPGSSSGDAGGSGGGDPVFGTTVFTAGSAPATGPAKGKSAHSSLGANNDPSGYDCIVAGCHLDTRPFSFGGTLYTDAAGAARVAGAEIRVTGPDGKLVGTTYSDADGNFWLPGAALPAGSHTGVRNATKVLDMNGAVGGARVGCQKAGCHVTGAGPGRVYLQ